MTHDEWENGKSLTIHNATKEQLKIMIKDRDNYIKKLQNELEEERKNNTELLEMLKSKM